MITKLLLPTYPTYAMPPPQEASMTLRVGIDTDALSVGKGGFWDASTGFRHGWKELEGLTLKGKRLELEGKYLRRALG